MTFLKELFTLLIFPGGLFILAIGMIYIWIDRKVLARLQNRIGPRWFQPLADMVKLLVKEEVVPTGVNPYIFAILPVIALAGPLTAALYIPMAGTQPAFSFSGDLIVTIYMMSLLTLSTGLAGANTINRFSLIGATRTLTQLFAYEAPFLLALLGPAIVAGSWNIQEIAAYGSGRWLAFTQPIGFVIALIGLIGKLEMAPFDAPEAETEIVAGALTEYSGRGLAMFHISRMIELVLGLTLVAAFYLGGVATIWAFFAKTIVLLTLFAALQALVTRLRIDQTMGLWWRYGAILVLGQWLVAIVWQGVLG